MNGKVMPFAGIRCRLTAMLMALWMPNIMTRPAAAKRQNGSSLREAMTRPRMTMKANSADDDEAGDDAEFLARHGEDEIGVGVGQDALHRALARSLAEPAAGHEAVERRIDLEGVDDAAAGGGIDEFDHARAHMRHEFIGEQNAAEAGAADADDPEPVQPGHEEQRRPDQRDQHRLAEIGLQDQRHDGQRAAAAAPSDCPARPGACRLPRRPRRRG